MARGSSSRGTHANACAAVRWWGRGQGALKWSGPVRVGAAAACGRARAAAWGGVRAAESTEQQSLDAHHTLFVRRVTSGCGGHVVARCSCCTQHSQPPVDLELRRCAQGPDSGSVSVMTCTGVAHIVCLCPCDAPHRSMCAAQ